MFHPPERLLAVFFEDLPDRASRDPFDALVEIQKRDLQLFRKFSSDARFPGAHKAGKNDLDRVLFPKLLPYIRQDLGKSFFVKMPLRCPDLLRGDRLVQEHL